MEEDLEWDVQRMVFFQQGDFRKCLARAPLGNGLEFGVQGALLPPLGD